MGNVRPIKKRYTIPGKVTLQGVGFVLFSTSNSSFKERASAFLIYEL